MNKFDLKLPKLIGHEEGFAYKALETSNLKSSPTQQFH